VRGTVREYPAACRSVDEVFRSERVNIMRPRSGPPERARSPNGGSARFRNKCLDWTLVFGRRYPERVLRIYEAHYNAPRPHRSLDLKAPDPRPDRDPWPADGGRVLRGDMLGGLIREYELAA
jgi:putative transposase